MLRDPTGLDGSLPPADRTGVVLAVRSWVRRVQPGIAFLADLLGKISLSSQAQRDSADNGASGSDHPEH